MTLMERRRAMMGGASNSGMLKDYDVVAYTEESYNFNARFMSNNLHFLFNKIPTTLKSFAEGVQYPGNYTLDFSKVKMTPPVSDYSFTQLAFAFANTAGTSTITFVMGANEYFNAGVKCFASSRITGIYGAKLLVSSFGNNAQNAFSGATNLIDAEFLPNVRANTVYFAYSDKLSDKTLISLANALIAMQSTQTITLHATPKARLATIMGRVESVTSGEETYDRFVQDDAGSVSLQDFITTTKGWTLG